MSDTDENKPAGKPGQRNRKGEQRRQKSAHPQSPKPDQLQSREPDPPQRSEPDQPQHPEPDRQPEAREPIESMAASPDSSPAGAAVPADSVPVSMQTIANAYGDFTMKSLEETRSFVEKLTGVRSLDKAMEVQTEFARQACQTFVAESEKIRGLHRELAKQIFKPLESMIARTTRDPR
jgi:hypothetical protein